MNPWLHYLQDMPCDFVIGGVIYNYSLIPTNWSDAGHRMAVAADLNYELKHSILKMKFIFLLKGAR